MMIVRQADGRHAVTDATGAVMGMHKSPWSAARQMHDYFQANNEPAPIEPGDVEPAREAVEAKGVGTKQSGIMERPKIPKPTDKRPKSFSAPRIPRP